MAAKYKIEIDQGSTFGVSMVLKQNGALMDLTGYSARASIRRNIKDTAAILSFTASVTVLTATVAISLTAAQTAGLTAGDSKESTESQYVYDVEIYTAADADVKRILEGALTVNPNVTR
jgi:hypothetical protein